MRYLSTRRCAPAVSFSEAVLTGLAPDGGLYLPEQLPPLAPSCLEPDEASDFGQLAAAIARPFIDGEIDDHTLEQICCDAFSFPVPLVAVGDHYLLELFWGPTFAFKDFGARFLARVMDHLAGRDGRRLTILVATSGDTGSAVAHGFTGMRAVDVVLLYPSGRVSRLQEQQLTTAGGNVVAVEVDGTFDDCQAMVKAMFADPVVCRHRPLSSANSINIGRLLPQVFYYVDAWRRLAGDRRRTISIVVPSGNFGNVTGALIARLCGLPVAEIVVGTNANDVVPRYLASGVFSPAEAIRTPASAMDVGNPSNFDRILALLGHDHRLVASMLRGYAIATPLILETINQVYREHRYLLDPHSAVGHAALARCEAEQPRSDRVAVCAATAHPAKFSDAITAATGIEVEIPSALAAALTREKLAVAIANRSQELRQILLDTAPRAL
jgi:threonine synthase